MATQLTLATKVDGQKVYATEFNAIVSKINAIISEYNAKVQNLSVNGKLDALYVENLKFQALTDIVAAINTATTDATKIDYTKLKNLPDAAAIASMINSLTSAINFSVLKNVPDTIAATVAEPGSYKMRIIVRVPSAVDPATVTCAVAPLKYNKDFVFTLTSDDGYTGIYGLIQRYVNNRFASTRRTVDYFGSKGYAYHDSSDADYRLGKYAGKLIGHTDGAGNRLPVRVGIAPIANWIASSQGMLNPYISETELQTFFDFFGGVYTHESGVEGATEYESLVKSLSTISTLIGKLPTVECRPNGDNKFVEAMWALKNYLAGCDENDSYAISQSTLNLKTIIAIDKLVFPAEFSWTVETFQTVVASLIGSGKLVHMRTHQISPGAVQDFCETGLKWLNDTYGADGTDTMWSATLDELFEYLYIRKNAIIVRTVNQVKDNTSDSFTGSKVIFDVEIPNPEFFKFKEVSLLIAGIDNSYDVRIYTDCVKQSQATSGSALLINASFNSNLVVLAEKYVAIAESKTASTIFLDYYNDALFFVNKLNASLQTTFLTRLNAAKSTAIPVAVTVFTPTIPAQVIVNQTSQISIATTPSNASNQSATYSSSNNEIVEINKDGLITAKAIGSATIRVTSNADHTKFVEQSVNVVSAENAVLVTAIAVSGNSSGNMGSTIQLAASITPSNATNQGVIWSSSDPAKATVNSSGLVTLIAAGSVIITATAQDGSGVTGTKALTINQVNIAVSAISVTGNATGAVGGTIQLAASITPSNATNKNVVWSSSDPAKATVNSSGLVTLIASGSVTITATAQDGSGIVGTKAITITASTVAVTGISITGNSSGTVGSTIQLAASITPSNATNQGVTWSSSDPAKATVNSSGLVTLIAAGSVTITATASDGSGVAGTKAITVNAASAASKVVVSFGQDINYSQLSDANSYLTINSEIVNYIVYSSYEGFDNKALKDVTGTIKGYFVVKPSLYSSAAEGFTRTGWDCFTNSNPVLTGNTGAYPDAQLALYWNMAAQSAVATNRGYLGFRSFAAGTYTIRILISKSEAFTANQNKVLVNAVEVTIGSISANNNTTFVEITGVTVASDGILDIWMWSTAGIGYKPGFNLIEIIKTA